MRVTRATVYRILIGIAVITTVAASSYAVINGQDYFSNRNLRQIGIEVQKFGILSPLIIFGLILLPSLIPVIPLPVQFLEIVAGIIFGFWPGLVLIWLSQIGVAMICFGLANKVGKVFIGRLEHSKTFKFYKYFVENKGAWAVFGLRATMSVPFNISYLAGLMMMKTKGFIIATALGAIPETVLFVYLGDLINQKVNFRLWYVFLLLLGLNYLPMVVLLTVSYIKSKRGLRQRLN